MTQPLILRLYIYPGEMETYVYTKICTVMLNSTFIHNSQKVDTTQMSLSR